jgi:FKBP-type peptidyl-prolyl cis-trans isomerase
MRKGIEIEDLCKGNGLKAERGHTVTIRYDGYLNRGDKFQENVTYRFRVGSRDVIAGLSYGVEGMRVGGLRRLRISPHLAYGASGVPGLIPANAVLTFEVELLELSDLGQQIDEAIELE